MSAPKSQIIEFLKKLDDKVEKLDSRLDSVDQTLIKQEGNLEHHIYRTQLAEENIKLVREEVHQTRESLEPIKKHVAYMEGALKAVGLIGVLLGILTAVIKIVEYLQA